MFSFFRPPQRTLDDYLARVATQPFSYDIVGCTQKPVHRPGWTVDHHRVLLGHGAAAFNFATKAIDSWRMFPQVMMTLCGAKYSPPEGTAVVILYQAALVRMWITFPARVVYRIADETERDGRTIHRFGFAYGTLDGHPERGEERFLVEWDRSDDSVWYDLMTISRPAHWLTRLGYPYARYEQARFRRLSGRAMQQAVLPVTGK